MAKTNHTELVKEIAKETSLRTEVVEEVLAALTNITVEKVVNGEPYSFLNLFSVSYNEIKNLKVPGTPGSTTSTVEYLGKKSLRARLSKNLRTLYSLQAETFPHQPYLVNRDSWRDALKWVREGGFDKTQHGRHKIDRVESDGAANPFLEEDD